MRVPSGEIVAPAFVGGLKKSSTEMRSGSGMTFLSVVRTGFIAGQVVRTWSVMVNHVVLVGL